jgi:hypothetical protein
MIQEIKNLMRNISFFNHMPNTNKEPRDKVVPEPSYNSRIWNGSSAWLGYVILIVVIILWLQEGDLPSSLNFSVVKQKVEQTSSESTALKKNKKVERDSETGIITLWFPKDGSCTEKLSMRAFHNLEHAAYVSDTFPIVFYGTTSPGGPSYIRKQYSPKLEVKETVYEIWFCPEEISVPPEGAKVEVRFVSRQ